VLFGVVVSLSIAKLLSGLAEFVQHPGLKKPDAVHLLWAASMLLELVHFWWWQFSLSHRAEWGFGVYAFILFYATLNYLLCSLLFPNALDEYRGYRDYFESRRAWFFGLMALACVADVVDTWLKGPERLVLLGPEYPVRIAAYLLLFGIAIGTTRRGFQLAFAIGNLAYQLSWIARVYNRVD